MIEVEHEESRRNRGGKRPYIHYKGSRKQLLSRSVVEARSNSSLAASRVGEAGEWRFRLAVECRVGVELIEAAPVEPSLEATVTDRLHLL